MESKPSRAFPLEQFTLGVGLTLSTAVVFAYVSLSIDGPFWWLSSHMPYGALPYIAHASVMLIGFALAGLIQLLLHPRQIGCLLLVSSLGVGAVILRDPELPNRWTMNGIVIGYLTICQILLPCLYGQMAEWKQKQTYALFAFVFLGSALAIFFDFVFNSYYYPDVWGFAALAALVAIFIFCVAWLVRSYQKANAERKDQAASPAPRMLRRLRWTLLGGLPAAVAVSYSDGFMLGVHTRAGLGFYILQIFWVIAYIRSAREKPFIFDGLIQTAMVPITMVCIDCILGSERFRPGDVAIFFMIFLAPWAMAVLLPRRLTLIIHSSLLAIILLRMFAAMPLGEIWISVLCNFLGAIVCWGCCSDAATDAPAADRLPGFAIFTQAGFVVFGIAFAMLPSVVLEHVVRLPIPLFLPHRANEYAFVLAVTASLVVRSIPWDRMTKTANGAKSEPEA